MFPTAVVPVRRAGSNKRRNTELGLAQSKTPSPEASSDLYDALAEARARRSAAITTLLLTATGTGGNSSSMSAAEKAAVEERALVMLEDEYAKDYPSWVVRNMVLDMRALNTAQLPACASTAATTRKSSSVLEAPLWRASHTASLHPFEAPVAASPPTASLLAPVLREDSPPASPSAPKRQTVAHETHRRTASGIKEWAVEKLSWLVGLLKGTLGVPGVGAGAGASENAGASAGAGAGAGASTGASSTQ